MNSQFWKQVFFCKIGDILLQIGYFLAESAFYDDTGCFMARMGIFFIKN